MDYPGAGGAPASPGRDDVPYGMRGAGPAARCDRTAQRAAAARQAWRWCVRLAQLALLAVALGGAAARIAALPAYVPDSGDEWGNTIAALRVLYERGNPGTFFHPSLYYYAVAAVDAFVIAAAKLVGAVPRGASITDVFVLDERYFVYAARGVSVAAGVAAMWVIYRLGASLWGRTSGLAAAALIAVCLPYALISDAVRVDSLAVLTFLIACGALVRLVGGQGSADRAAAATGLAIGANYPGAALLPWLAAAQVYAVRERTRRRSPVPRRAPRQLVRLLAIALLAFLATSPFLVLDLPTAIRYLAFISGLSVAPNPGMEGRGAFYYVTALAEMNPVLTVLLGAAILVVVCAGGRRERFLLAVAVGYLVVFSLMRTKFYRFVLPALALLLLLAGGIPTMLHRRLAGRPRLGGFAAALAWAALGWTVTTMVPQAIPVPRYLTLARSDHVLLDWLEAHAAPGSTVWIEAGIVPLIDAANGPGRFAAALRKSIGTMRPRLADEFITAAYVGGIAHYGAGVLSDAHVDYAIISPRTVTYIESRCEAFPEVCAFYRELRRRGSVAFATGEDAEPAVVYEVPRL
jgi:hypothetical protein